MVDFTFPENGDEDDAYNFSRWTARSPISNYVETGLTFTPDHTNENLDISAGRAYIMHNDEDKVLDVDARTNLAFATTTGVNYVFLTGDWTVDDSISYVIKSTNSAPTGPSLKVGEVDAANDTHTEQNRGMSMDVESQSVDSSNIKSDLNILDSALLNFGSDGDFYFDYNATDDSLELFDQNGTKLLDVANNGPANFTSGLQVGGTTVADQTWVKNNYVEASGGDFTGDVYHKGGADNRHWFDSGVTGDGAINAFWFTDQNGTPVDQVKWHREGAAQYAFEVVNASTGVSLLRVTDAGAVSASGNTVWHAGNFTPASKVDDAGDAMTGNLDMNQNQLVQPVIDNRISDPASPVAGQRWYRTDLD